LKAFSVCGRLLLGASLESFAKAMSYHHDTLAAIGTLVVVSQTAERMLKMLLTFVLQDGVPLTYERIMELDEHHRRKTLGYFIREMKKRATFEDSIDSSLERFLANRNRLVHHFDQVSGNDLETPDDIAQVTAFLDQLWQDLESVLLFCSAMLHAWTEETGIAKGSIDQYIEPVPSSLIS
jgi:hypothetical protein